MKRVLVTGGTGFIGANLARRLLQEGHQVHLLVRPWHDPRRIADILSTLHLHLVDLDDAAGVMEVVRRSGPEWVFHLAAHGAYSWQHDPHAMIRTNIAGTVNLLEACLQSGFEAFVHAGTSSEYGFKSSAPLETEWLEPNSPYAVTKAAASLHCRQVARRTGAHIVTLRLYSIYGPFEDANRLVPSLIRFGLKGTLPPLADPQAAHDYVFVADLLEAFLLAAATPGQEIGAIYNVGSGIQVTLQEMVQAVMDLFHLDVEPAWNSFPGRTWDTRTWVSDPRRIAAALGWHPAHTLAQGLARTVEWFRDHPAFLG